MPDPPMIVKAFGCVKENRAMRAKILHAAKILRDHGAGRSLAYRVNRAYGTTATA
jgi:hypothetical protein